MSKKTKLTLLKTPEPGETPDPQDLLEHQLELFQKRYMESQHHIMILERGLHLLLTQKHISPKALQEIQQQLEAISNRQKIWLEQLTDILHKGKKTKAQKKIPL